LVGGGRVWGREAIGGGRLVERREGWVRLCLNSNKIFP